MRKIGVFSLSALVAAVSVSALAQGNRPSVAYRPGLGDLMTMTVQPRHLKLGLAGQEKNWAFAAYELHELEESFERIARVWPKWRQVEIAETIKSTTAAPLEAVERSRIRMLRALRRHTPG
jgi:hypothetical protein